MSTTSPSSAEPHSQQDVDSVGPASSIPASRWLLGLVLAAVAAWFMLNHWPYRFVLPEELTGGTVANNPELSARAAKVSAENSLKNGLVGLIGAALAFGVIPVLCCWGKGSGKFVGPLILAMVLGIACGAGAMYSSRAVLSYFKPSEEVAAELEEPGILGDLLAYVIISSLLVLPAASVFIFSPNPQVRQKWLAVPLAGGVAGALVTIAVSVALPTLKTDVIPTPSSTLAAIWLAAMVVLVFGLSQSTGNRSAKS